LKLVFTLIGTSERVCLITGNVGAIMAVLIFIMEKIREKPDINAKQAIDFDNKTSAERDKQVGFICSCIFWKLMIIVTCFCGLATFYVFIKSYQESISLLL
jgi:hypothetical protein